MVHLARPEMTGEEAMRTIRTATQAAIMDDPDFDYPSPSYTKPKVWYRAHTLLDNPRQDPSFREHDEMRHAQFIFNHFRRLSTTISSRSVTHKLLGLVLAHRVGDQPLILDVGCGDNSSNRRLLLNNKFPYTPLRVVRTLPRAGAQRAGLPRQSGVLADIMAKPYAPRRIVGVDLIDPTEEANVRWVRACPTPEELVSGAWASIHDPLIREPLGEDRLGFLRADFSDAGDMRTVRKRLGRQADLVSASLSWYQGPAAERRAKFDHAVRCARAGGFVLVQDFAERNLRRPNYLAPMRTWHAMNAFLYEVDTKKLHHVLQYDSGRPRYVRVLPALAQLAAGGPYEREVRQLVVQQV